MSGAGARLVVVGVDGSPEGVDAARFAAEEASIRGLELLVVHAVPPGSDRNVPPTAAGRADARRLVDETLAQIWVAPTTRVRTVVGPALPAALLTALTHDAALLVVGQQRRDPEEDRPAGQVSAGQVSAAVGAHAQCPVVVVPSGWARPVDGSALHDPLPIVVGLGEPSSATSALRVAYEEADLRHASLLILHTSTGADPAHSPSAVTVRTAAEVVAGRCEDHPDVRIDYRFVPGATLRGLVESSSRAS